MKIRIPLHPVLFAVYPVLFLYSSNIQQAESNFIWKPIIGAISAALLILMTLRRVIGDYEKAGLYTSLCIVMFFSYGHVHNVLLDADLGMGRNRYLVPVWITLFAIGILLIRRVGKSNALISAVLNAISVVLVVLALMEIGGWSLLNSEPRSTTLELEPSILDPSIEQQDETVVLNKPEVLPDIYYIILDGYMRPDIQLDVLGYDSSDFTNHLIERDFYLATASYSNYPYTMFSLASSLNMEYVNYLSEEIGIDSQDLSVPNPLIHANRVGYLLKSLGYRYVQVGSWWIGTNRSDVADQVLTWRDGYRRREEQFIATLLETTALAPLFRGLPPRTLFRDDNRLEVLYEFDQIPHLGNQDQPTFVFAHIISPHPPYVFGLNGEVVHTPEGGWNSHETRKAYLNQLIFINGEVQNLIDAIVQGSQVDPIIIIQSDHGWAWAAGWDLYPDTPLDVNFDMKQVYGILNAYHLPGDGDQYLYESISPVNTFRLIFNVYFGGEFELLPDESFFSDYYESPYEFANVTGNLEP